VSLAIAAALLVVMALAHSIAGEVVLLRHLPELRPLPAIFGGDGRRALRACWHTPTVLGGGLAALLWRFSSLAPLAGGERLFVKVTSGAMLGTSLVWLAVSRGRHAGWAGFLAVAVLCWLA
jgi:hypothetical protein